MLLGLYSPRFLFAQSRIGPSFELLPGEHYFRIDGKPSFVLGRNPVGMNPKAYEEQFHQAASAGERFVRIHFTYLPPGEKAGGIDAGMLQSWDAVLEAAEKERLAVLPVLGVWSDWNEGSSKETWHAWDKSPFNAAHGGPAHHPGELFDDTRCRKLWLNRLDSLVRRWAHHRAIVGWEIFSELDLVTGATEERAVAFTESAADVIRSADPWKRPISASQSGIGEWPLLLKSKALDFIEIHPYADGVGGQLDDLILSTVRTRLAKYGKPVLIGESGLNSGPPHNTLDVAPRAEVGIRHAIWAAVVSGAMNGRALWWQDGYDQFENADICRHYFQAAATAAAFVKGMDFTGFVPVRCRSSEEVKGAVLGSDRTRLGWFRDTRCAPPNWLERPVSGQTMTMDAPGTSWHVGFYDSVTGKLLSECQSTVHEGHLQIALPDFHGSIAIRFKRIV